MVVKLFEKQIQAYEYLSDTTITEVLYGGGARGGKSWLGNLWQILRRISMPESAGLIAREELTKLKDTTLLTFFKVLKAYGLSDQVHYNAQNYTATFKNGSIIFFREIKYLPSDPEFDRLGSYDLTDCFLDEAQQISYKAVNVLKGRFSVLQGEGWQTIPKSLYTCNPKRNWIYTEFVSPSKTGLILPHRKFIKALPSDNPHVSQDYIDNLLRSDKVTIQRLYHGNFEYDDDPTVLCDYDAIMDCFTNKHAERGTKYISADLAMKGRDRFVVGLWDGNVCEIKIDKTKSSGKEIETDVKSVMITGRVGHSNTVVDSDGMGSYLESYLTGIKEFHGGARAVDDKEYANLKSECAYKLAELINKRELAIICTPEQQQRIAEEIAVLKADDIDADEKKKRIIKKEVMKELLGRSPDYLDMLLMRMYFAIKKKGVRVFAD